MKEPVWVFREVDATVCMLALATGEMGEAACSAWLKANTKLA
jgi:hypothetical protein